MRKSVVLLRDAHVTYVKRSISQVLLRGVDTMAGSLTCLTNQLKYKIDNANVYTARLIIDRVDRCRKTN